LRGKRALIDHSRNQRELCGRDEMVEPLHELIPASSVF